MYVSTFYIGGCSVSLFYLGSQSQLGFSHRTNRIYMYNYYIGTLLLLTPSLQYALSYFMFQFEHNFINIIILRFVRHIYVFPSRCTI